MELARRTPISGSWSQPWHGSGAWAMSPLSSSGTLTWDSTAAVSKASSPCPGGRMHCETRGQPVSPPPGSRHAST
eukprot:1490629-Lingulodinium_polyedra.AAC.1